MANKRLLIIEDDYDVAEMLLLYFNANEYDTFHADTGHLGIEMARTKSPNLILLDIMLPDAEGYEVCRQIRETALTRYIPVIFLTQLDERANKVKGLALGADDYIAKPFDVDELRLRVQRSIRRATLESLHEPRTGLPTGKLVDDEIALFRFSGEPYHEIRLALAGFQAYNDVYGFMAANEAFSYASRAVQEIVVQQGTPHDFVGVKEDNFVLLTRLKDPRPLEDAIKNKFADGIKAFYTFTDVDRGGLILNPGTMLEETAPLMTFHSFSAAV